MPISYGEKCIQIVLKLEVTFVWRTIYSDDETDIRHNVFHVINARNRRRIKEILE